MRNLLKTTRILFAVLAFITVSAEAFAQNITVQGKVTDASSGEALPGVNIVIKGTTRGTSTDVDGNYSITVPSGGTLVFSYVGYLTQELAATSPTLNVAMEPEVARLNEVVVIGYGTVKKADATGSVAVVNSEQFNRGAITNPQGLLIGKAPGVVITTSGGAPGAGATIRIRGGSSLSASNDPLIVVDGIPLGSDSPSGATNPLSTINPNDIESITILKDASATAIYGSRASNGVIMITTKKSTKKFSVTYSGNVAMNTVPGTVPVLSADEFRSLVEELYGTSHKAYQRLGTANTDWQKQIYETALTNDHNLSISGTAAKIPYRASVGYTNENGILKTSNFERTTLALGLDPSFLDNHLNIKLNIKGMYNKNRFANQGAIGAAVTFDPTHPIYDEASPNGYFFWAQPNGDPINIATANPVALLNLTRDMATVKRSIGNLQADYKFHFLPDLKLTFNAGYDYSQSDGTVDVPATASWVFDKINGGGIKRTYDQTRKMELMNLYLNYAKEIEPISSRIDFTAGYEWQHFYRKGKTYETNIPIDDAHLIVRTNEPYATENYLVSFFGRLNYVLKDKYLLTFTLRDDGSSRFAPENRWGLFPSLALAWKINEEGFMKNISAVSDLKLRLGYGVTGQQEIGGDYPYLPRYTYSSQDNTAQYQFGSTYYNTLRPEGYDVNIKWEETTTYNAGLDFGFAKNRIYGSVDVYQRKTKDLLNYIPVPAGSNLTNYITTNVGDLENKGFEVSLGAKIISTKDLVWQVDYNLSYNKNKITKLTATDDPTYLGVFTGGIAGGVGNTIQIHSVGYPANSFFVYKQVYDQNGKPIEGLYVDMNNDGVINTSDLYRYKKPAPDYAMGISSNLRYKNFDFSFSGRINIGNYVYNNVFSNRGTYLDVYNPGLNYLSNVLTASKDIQFRNAQYFSDYFVENASFFRMDNISLGYQLPGLLQNKLNMHISAVVQNAFIITKYSGLDPEVDGGIDNNFYPRPRTFMLGLNVQF